MNKQSFLKGLVVLIGIALVFMLWFHNYTIIDGDYTKLTIKRPDDTIEVITDKEQIETIIQTINQNPRNIGTELPLYQYELGSLVFENGSGKEAVHYMVSNGNIHIKFGEVETGFSF